LAGRLDPEVETVLYRVAREAMTNVEKHAQASRLWLTLAEDGEEVRLEVRDDGRGFDAAAAASQAGRDHFGLLGMRERVELAGGAWSLETGPGRGAAVRASFVRRPPPALRAVRESLLSLAGLLNGPVVNQAGEEIGTLVDLVARWADEPYPPVTGLVVRVARRQVFVPAEQVIELDRRGARLRSARLGRRAVERRPGEVLLGGGVREHQPG